LLTLLWIGTSTVTGIRLQHEMNEVFDTALQETAQRILPLAVVDVVDREEEGITQRLAAIRAHDERFTYIVRDAEGRILIQSHAADPAAFPDYDGPGFRQTATHRLYNEDALQGSVQLTVAEPLAHREQAAWETLIGLGLPLLGVIPITLIAVGFVLRLSLSPLRQFRDALATRGARDMSPVEAGSLPGEIAPISDTLNELLARLKAAFDAERSFAANAAHELRTPLAGAIAQAQRLQAETSDAEAAGRANEIEASLKRLTRVSERLMQMARAEGGRLRTDNPRDVKPVLQIIMGDLERLFPIETVSLAVPDLPVLSDIDPDAFGILIRNLVENAFRNATAGTQIKVILSPDGRFSVENECPAIAPEVLEGLTNRFERPNPSSDGAGLGLAIVATIADRIDGRLKLKSPVPGKASGFLAEIDIPVAPGSSR
jgi:two-component system OmpR family sensor kinase